MNLACGTLLQTTREERDDIGPLTIERASAKESS